MNSYKKQEDEIQFKDLLKNPIRLFGWVFPIFLLLFLALGIYFVKHLNEVSYNVQPVGLTDSTLMKKEVEMRKGGVMTAVDLNLVKSPTPAFIAKGKELFAANCKSCHGDSGLGDGAAAVALVKKPRNLHSTDGWTNGRNIDQLFKTLQEGIINNGMAAYEYLPAADRFAIISFMRTFAEYPTVTDEQLKSLDAAYNLSVGTTIPNNIPVGLAENKMIEEYTIVNDKFLSFEKKIFTSKGNSGVEILKKSALDYRKIFFSFINPVTGVTLDKYVSVVLANPISSGFKPTVAHLTKEEWKKLHDYLKTVTM